MKNIFLLLAIMLCLGVAKAQPVSDNAIIPVSVTLNSILRLQVSSGGNIEFVINTIDQYRNGISNLAVYDTKFSVASSTDFHVDLSAESNLLPNDISGGEDIPIGNLGYKILYDGGVVHCDLNPDFGAITNPTILPITNAIITARLNEGAGDSQQNKWVLQWEFGTLAARTAGGLAAQNLLQQSINPGRYSTNIYLTLIPQ